MLFSRQSENICDLGWSGLLLTSPKKHIKTVKGKKNKCWRVSALKTNMHEKLFALEIKSKHLIPGEIAGTTCWDFMLDKVINLSPKTGVYDKRCTNVCFLQKSLIKMVYLYLPWIAKDKNRFCQANTKGQTHCQLFQGFLNLLQQRMWAPTPSMDLPPLRTRALAGRRHSFAGDWTGQSISSSSHQFARGAACRSSHLLEAQRVD